MANRCTALNPTKSVRCWPTLQLKTSSAHAREALAELFWPDRPSGKAMANLRHALAGLRKTIGDAAMEPPFLTVTRYSIQLNPEADVAADLTKIAKVDEAGDFEATAVRQAAALYRGPFLDGFALDDCPEFEAWMITVRERTEWMVMRVLGRLVANCCRQHDFNQAVAWTEKQLALQPWNEEIHQQLIWLLARSGQHSAAQQQFEHCRTMLAAEFDVEPQPATLALIKQVINGSELPAEMPGQTGSEVLLAQKRPDVHISGFPSLRGSLLGREAELDRLDRRLREPACRLLTIVGVGGAGKTRLAIEAAECCAGLYRDGVYFVPLADVERGELLVNAILQALQAPVIGSADPPQQLLRYLAGKEMLLVLDNFEQLVESGAFLATLIESTPGLDILVTSRERLNLSIEWLLPLEGLEAPDGEPMPAYKRSPSSFAAVQLFIERMRQLQPNLAQDEATVAQIGRICRLLDGLPLAIELAATWTRLLALDEMIYQLTQGIDLLSTTQRDVPTRHRSMPRGLRSFLAASANPGARCPSPTRRLPRQFLAGWCKNGGRGIAGLSVDVIGQFMAAQTSRWPLRHARAGETIL